MARTLKLDTITHPSNSGTANQTLNASGQTAMPTVDIDGGTIDNTTIGGSTKAAGSFTTLTCSSLAPATGQALVLKEDGGSASITVGTDGSVTLANNITVSGNSTVGDASTDTMTINATADGSNNRSGITGEIRMFSTSSAPSGWLVCDGSAINTYTYRVLHAVVSNTYGGTAYNAGVTDQPGATTTFTLPDFRGRTAIGVNDAARDADSAGTFARGIKTLAGTGGADSHKITEGELPPHSHTLSAGTVDGSGSLVTGTESADHTHTYTSPLPVTEPGSSSARTGENHTGDVEMYPTKNGHQTLGKSATHTHTTPSHSHTLSGSTANAGSGNYHNNLQPYLTVVYIIKT